MESVIPHILGISVAAGWWPCFAMPYFSWSVFTNQLLSSVYLYIFGWLIQKLRNFLVRFFNFLIFNFFWFMFLRCSFGYSILHDFWETLHINCGILLLKSPLSNNCIFILMSIRILLFSTCRLWSNALSPGKSSAKILEDAYSLHSEAFRACNFTVPPRCSIWGRMWRYYATICGCSAMAIKTAEWLQFLFIGSFWSSIASLHTCIFSDICWKQQQQFNSCIGDCKELNQLFKFIFLGLKCIFFSLFQFYVVLFMFKVWRSRRT